VPAPPLGGGVLGCPPGDGTGVVCGAAGTCGSPSPPGRARSILFSN